MYFGLSELSEAGRDSFIEQVRAMIVKPELVLITPKADKKKIKTGLNLSNTTIDVKYRLIVSFISKGAGTDNKAAESVKTYIESHPKKPLFEVKKWGREGEKN